MLAIARGDPKRAAKDATFVTFVLEQLGEGGRFRARGMFGGHGLYAGEEFMGIVFDGRLYFRVDDASRPDYESRGMRPFSPGPRMTMPRYFEVPVDVLEDRRTLVAWAERAIQAAPKKSAVGSPRASAGAKTSRPETIGAASSTRRQRTARSAR